MFLCWRVAHRDGVFADHHKNCRSKKPRIHTLWATTILKSVVDNSTNFMPHRTQNIHFGKEVASKCLPSVFYREIHCPSWTQQTLCTNFEYYNVWLDSLCKTFPSVLCRFVYLAGRRALGCFGGCPSQWTVHDPARSVGMNQSMSSQVGRSVHLCPHRDIYCFYLWVSHFSPPVQGSRCLIIKP